MVLKCRHQMSILVIDVWDSCRDCFMAYHLLLANGREDVCQAGWLLAVVCLVPVWMIRARECSAVQAS
jgi:hypothetical protein